MAQNKKEFIHVVRRDDLLQFVKDQREKYHGEFISSKDFHAFVHDNTHVLVGREGQGYRG